MAINPTSGVNTPATQVNQASPAHTSAVTSENGTAAPATPQAINPEAVAKALKDYQKIRDKLKQPGLAGAASLFTGSVEFPEDLLDPNNPANDTKYLHMLLAMFGLKELTQFFETLEQEGEDHQESLDDNEDEGEDAQVFYVKPKKSPTK